MSDREAILGRIRRSLEVNRTFLEREAARHAGPHPEGPFLRSLATPVELFTTELEALQGHVHHCHGAAAALEAVCGLLVSHEADSVLHWAWDQLPLVGLEQALREHGIKSADPRLLGMLDRADRLQALHPVPICISGTDAAIAESGTLLVMSGAGRPRMASLLPPVHIAIVPVERIVRSLPEAFALIQERHGAAVVRERSNITLISGPSRTGDIEQSLTLGVHGPKEIHAVIVDAPQTSG
jgi:L-lactate dehydrogenase complex protein LldG